MNGEAVDTRMMEEANDRQCVLREGNRNVNPSSGDSNPVAEYRRLLRDVEALQTRRVLDDVTPDLDELERVLLAKRGCRR